MIYDMNTGRRQQSRRADDVQPARGQLEDAFNQFNQLSEKLASSYNELETQVAYMSEELAEARSERLKQLAEKEILAERLEGLLAALPAGVVVLDKQGIIGQANPVARDMLGDDLDGQTWQAIASRALITDGDELRLQDGRWLSLSIRTLDADSGKIILLADVTETHSLQVMLNRKQRLTSLGEMVASLAHQLRTPLAAALLYISTLNHPVTRNEDKKGIVNKARERLLHLERMVNDMLIFARGDVMQLEVLDVDELVDQLRLALEEQFEAAGVELHINQSTHGVAIRANRDTLISAFQNIADNALEACAEKSTLETRTVELKQPAARLDITVALTDEQTVIFEFVDNGVGMSSQQLDRVLEPFFTTRSSGTGLGLAVVNATIESFSGKLNITSQQGVGSSFCITLPEADKHELLSSDLSAGEHISNKEVMI